jgi:hypothetical protein
MNHNDDDVDSNGVPEPRLEGLALIKAMPVYFSG